MLVPVTGGGPEVGQRGNTFFSEATVIETTLANIAMNLRERGWPIGLKPEVLEAAIAELGRLRRRADSDEQQLCEIAKAFGKDARDHGSIAAMVGSELARIGYKPGA